MKLGDFNWGFKGLWIPKELLLDERITWIEKGLASFCFGVDNGDGFSISNDDLEGLLSIGKSQVKRLLSNLRRYKYIGIEMKGVERIIHSRIDYVVGGSINGPSPYQSLSLLDPLKRSKEKDKEKDGGGSKMNPSFYSKEEESEISEYYLVFKKKYLTKYGIIFSQNGLTKKQKGQMAYIIKRMKKDNLDVTEYFSFCFSDNGYYPKEGTLSIGWVAYRDCILKFLDYKGISHKPVSEYRRKMAESIDEGTTRF